jgi:HTH-type transcriptional regulator / antitoxin HigA
MYIRPIRTAADHTAALQEIAALMASDPELGTPEGDKLDVLATLVEASEDAHFTIEAADPVEGINFRMDQQGLTVHDLVPMVWRLHRELGIPAGSLIRPPTA